MALGPEAIREIRKPAIQKAEAIIDDVIKNSGRGDRVVIDARPLGITYAEWNEELKHKYLAAGWKRAEWTSDQREGDFIDLRSK